MRKRRDFVRNENNYRDERRSVNTPHDRVMRETLKKLTESMKKNRRSIGKPTRMFQASYRSLTNDMQLIIAAQS